MNDIGTMPYFKHSESNALRCRTIPELIAYFKCSDTIPSIPGDEPKCNFLMYLFAIASYITLLFNSPFRRSSYFSRTHRSASNITSFVYSESQNVALKYLCKSDTPISSCTDLSLFVLRIKFHNLFRCRPRLRSLIRRDSWLELEFIA